MATGFILPFAGRGLSSRDPFHSLHREMNRLFDDTFRSMDSGAGSPGGSGRSNLLAPQLDVHESQDEFCVTVDLPGVAEQDLDLALEGDLLTIRGEKKQESERDERGYHVVERSSGTFQRSLRLPFEPDPERVSAECRDGVLTIHVPKVGQQQRSRRIEVNRGQGGEPGQRTIDNSAAANDRQHESLQQAASQGQTRQAGGANDAGQQAQASPSGEQQGHNVTSGSR